MPLSALGQQYDTKGFECGFIYDKFKGGKSSEAACSYDGEKVFGTAGEPFPARLHCKTESVGGFHDLINFRIDLAANTVTWDDQYGLSAFYQLEMIKYYMQTQKISEAEATAKVKGPWRLIHYAFNIRHTEKIYDHIHTDEINRELLKTPQHVPAYLITFGDEDSNYSLYIPGKNNNAILSEYVGDNDASWVNLRFGKCRKLGSVP
jgi:hypothetical protein